MKTNILLVPLFLSASLPMWCTQTDEKEIKPNQTITLTHDAQKVSRISHAHSNHEINVPGGFWSFELIPNSNLVATPLFHAQENEEYVTMYNIQTGQHVRDLKSGLIETGGTSNPEGTKFICCTNGHDGNPLFDIGTGAVETLYGQEEVGTTIGAYFSPDETEIWLVDFDFNIIRFDKKTGKKIGLYPDCGLCLSQDRTKGIRRTKQEHNMTTVEIIDIMSQRTLGAFDVVKDLPVVQLNPKYKTCCVTLWDISNPVVPQSTNTAYIDDYNGNEINHYTSDKDLSVTNYSQDGSTLALGCLKYLALVNPANGKKVGSVTPAGWVEDIKMNFSGIASLSTVNDSSNTIIEFWDFDNLEKANSNLD